MRYGKRPICVFLSLLWGGAGPGAVGIAVAGELSGGPLEDRGARSLGAGGTGLADPADTAVGSQSVAALSLFPRYDASAGVGLGADGYLHLQATAVDTRTSQVSLAATWYRSADQAPVTGAAMPGWKIPGDELLDPTSRQGVTAALAYPFFDRRGSVGIGGRYDWRESALSGKQAAWNLSLSAAARPVDLLTVAFTAHNLIEQGYPELGRSVELGARLAPGPYLGLEVDGALPVDSEARWDQARLSVGGSVGVVELLALRAGWSLQRDGGDGVRAASAGISLLSERASLDYGLHIPLGGGSLQHGLDLRLFF